MRQTIEELYKLDAITLVGMATEEMMKLKIKSCDKQIKELALLQRNETIKWDESQRISYQIKLLEKARYGLRQDLEEMGVKI
jgi:hypothetical protein